MQLSVPLTIKSNRLGVVHIEGELDVAPGILLSTHESADMMVNSDFASLLDLQLGHIEEKLDRRT